MLFHYVLFCFLVSTHILEVSEQVVSEILINKLH